MATETKAEDVTKGMSASAKQHHQELMDSISHKHSACPSLLNTFLSGTELEPTSEGQQAQDSVSYRGLLNLCMIVFALGNLRLIISNIRKYGLIVDYSLIYKGFGVQDWPNVWTVAGFSVFVLFAFLLELWALKQVQQALKSSKSHSGSPTKTPLVSRLQVVNVFALFMFPVITITIFKPNPLANLNSLMIATCIFCKLWSYADVNARMRALYELKVLEAAAKINNEDGNKKEASSSSSLPYHPTSPTEYPNNLHVSDIAYFVFTPTLCYETNFPRTDKIRWVFVLKRLTELIIIAFVEYFIAMQYMLPLLTNTLQPFSRFDIVFLSERIIKMAVPNMIIWLLGFYALFHCHLNIIAELLRFGDRQFYSDWWNCTTVADFWRKWNLPVKNWFFQHVYKPMLEQGYSRVMAQLTIFFVSAVFHELIVSVAFSTIQFWAFSGMLAQVGAILISQPLKGKQLGNIFFWVTIILGQPLIVLFYFVDYVRRNTA